MDFLAIDIGGVNLKAAHSFGQAICRPFALREDPGQLGKQLHALANGFPSFDELLITMTGELCDCFANKREGVACILDAVEAAGQGRRVRVWLTDGCFGHPARARREPYGCAAANWHALATAIAAANSEASVLLIDTGSTTTDVTLLQGGVVGGSGLTDMDRLSSGGLVYVGVERTPIAALGPTVNWGGRTVGLTSEFFATTADVFLLTGRLPEASNNTDTADGRPKTSAGAAIRLARMVGADTEILDKTGLLSLADALTDRVVERIADGVRRVVGDEVPEKVIVAGSGDWVAADAAERLFPAVPIEWLAKSIGRSNSTAACAWALLRLAEDAGGVQPMSKHDPTV